MNKITVLVIDDHPLLREGLIKILSLDDDVEIVGEAGDGEEGIKLVDKLKPQVVLLDINLPKINGILVCKMIKERHPDTQVIVLTVCEEERQVLEIVRAGANGYLLKDVEPDVLLQAVKDAVAGKAPLHPKIAGTVLQQFGKMAKALDENQESLLTNREKEIIQLMAKGATNRAIAKTLYISEKTVKNHITNIFRKLKVGDRTEAVVKAMEKRII